MFDSKKVKNELVQWIRNWFDENGQDCNAVIGISGGKDSTVAAALCVEALGKDRVIGVLMPNGVQSDIEDSQRVCSLLGIKNYTINIGETAAALREEIGNAGVFTTEQARINLPPRLRMATLFAVAQSLNGRVCCNSNLSERYIGYFTFGGDNIGSFAPLANLTVTEVINIGDALGLPYDLVHKTPSDGLCGKSDEENIGISYDALDRYLMYCEGDQETRRKIEALHEKNKFKLREIESFVL